MRRINVAPYESWRYSELHEITEWKAGCVYKTEFRGCIRSGDIPVIQSLYPGRYVTANFSTKLTSKPEGFWIDVFTSEEIASL